MSKTQVFPTFRPSLLPYAWAVICFLTSTVLTALDASGQFRWLGFVLYCGSIGFVFSSLFGTLYTDCAMVSRRLVSKSLWGLLVVGLVAVLSRGWWLTTYPFVSVGDEVREVGLYAQQIAAGTRRNLFDYGAYQAYSLTISTVSALFYFLLGPTVLTYRLQAAALGVLDVGLVMLIVWHSTHHKRMTGLTGLALATLPLHLYYSRTEVVVMYSSTAAALLYLVWVRLRSHFARYRSIAVYATLLGMALGLYAAVRTVALLLLLLTSWRIIYITWKTSKTSAVFAVNLAKRYAVLGVFLLVGFGPRLLYTTPAIFFHTSRLPLAHQTQTTLMEKLQVIEHYGQSLAVWFNRPTTSWYADHRPIVWPVLTVCLGIGIAWVVLRRQSGLLELLGVGLAVHLTNSAITDMINADHRLAPVYILGAIFMGIGLGWLTSLPKHQWVQRATLLISVGVLLAHGAGFFFNLPANKNKTLADYQSMHVVYILQQTGVRFNTVKITAAFPTYEKLNTVHYREQYAYFLRGTQMSATVSAGLAQHEVIVDTEPKLPNSPRAFYIRCTTLTCPTGQQEPLLVMIR